MASIISIGFLKRNLENFCFRENLSYITSLLARKMRWKIFDAFKKLHVSLLINCIRELDFKLSQTRKKRRVFKVQIP